MFVHDHLIIGYIIEPEQNRYFFMLAGGEERSTDYEEFIAHWQEYRQFEKEREAQNMEHYHPLPITMVIRQSISTRPVDVTTRRRRQTA